MEEETKPCFLIHGTTEGSVRATVTARIVDGCGGDRPGSSPRTMNAGSKVGNRQIKAVPLENLGLESVFSPQNSLVRNFTNFKRSGVPSRIMFFGDEAWNDFPESVVGILRAGFVAGKTTLEVPIGGSSYIFDFLRMSQVDAATGSQKSVAWIDVNGQCFFPKMVVCEQRSASRSNLEIEVRIDGGRAVPSCERKRATPEPQEEHSDESQVISAASFEKPRWAGLEILNGGDRYYKVVETLFLAGMRRFDPNTRISSIYKCSHTGPSGNSRLRAFQMQIQMTKAARGTANVKFGWYGTSVEGMTSVITHGFGRPNNRLLGSEAHGVGVHLSPPHSPHTSSLLSEADGTGEKYVLLCRVIMGNAEKVEAGSARFHPSSDEFDCGVDDLKNPRWYIVWSTHMNTHIIPEYVVGFKTSGPSRRLSSLERTSTKPTLSFPKLFAEMGDSLHSSRMQALEIQYDRFKAGKIGKYVFVRQLRSIAGDKLLATAIKRFQNRL